MDNIYKTMYKSGQCNVCFEVVTTPLLPLCDSGHSICIKCKPSTMGCTLCKPGSPSPSCLPRNHHVLDIAHKNCSYQEAGCEVIMSQGGDHEEYCEFRPTRCYICQWSGKVKELRSHVQIKHRSVFYNFWCTKNNKALTFVNFRSTKLGYCAFYAYNQVFWICFKEDVTSKQLVAHSILVPNSKPLCSYYVTFRLQNEDINYKYTIKCSYSTMNIQDDLNVYKMELPCSMVFKKGLKCNDLDVTVTLKKEHDNRCDIWFVLRCLLIFFLVFVFIGRVLK